MKAYLMRVGAAALGVLGSLVGLVVFVIVSQLGFRFLGIVVGWAFLFFAGIAALTTLWRLGVLLLVVAGVIRPGKAA